MGANQNNGPKQGQVATIKAYAGATSVTRPWSHRGADILAGSDPIKLHTAVEKAATIGAAILFGATRDGGSCTVTLFHQEQRLRFYPNSAEELDQWCDDVREWASGTGPDLTYWQ